MTIQSYCQKILNKCPIPIDALKKLGIAGLLFFTFKGVVWLAVFVWFYRSLEWAGQISETLLASVSRSFTHTFTHLVVCLLFVKPVRWNVLFYLCCTCFCACFAGKNCVYGTLCSGFGPLCWQLGIHPLHAYVAIVIYIVLIVIPITWIFGLGLSLYFK